MMNGSPLTMRRTGRPILSRIAFFVAFLLLTGLTSGCSSIEEAKKQSDIASTLQEADRQFSLGHVVQGESWCQKAIDLDPDSAATYLGLNESGVQFPGVVQVLTDHGDYPDIVTYVTKALKSPTLSQNWRLYMVLADAQAHMGNTAAQAQADRSEVSAIDKQFTTPGATIDTGDNSDLIIAKADAEWGYGDFPNAIKDYHNFMVANPENASIAQNDQAYNQAVSKYQLPVALGLAREAVNTARHGSDDDTLGQYLDTLGWVEHQMGDDKDAVNDLEQATSLVPHEGDCAFHLANVYQALGRTQDAVVEYQRTLQLQPYNVDAQTELSSLTKKMPAVAAAPA